MILSIVALLLISRQLAPKLVGNTIGPLIGPKLVCCSPDWTPPLPSPLHHTTYLSQIHEYTNTQIHKYTNTQTHKYTNTQIHKYTNTQTHKYTNTHGAVVPFQSNHRHRGHELYHSLSTTATNSGQWCGWRSLRGNQLQQVKRANAGRVRRDIMMCSAHCQYFRC